VEERAPGRFCGMKSQSFASESGRWVSRHVCLPVLALLLPVLIACSARTNPENSQPPAPAQASLASSSEAASDGNLGQLFSRIWRVTKFPSPPAPGSIYIFLSNGTLLETSCVETYRIATWTIDKKAPRILRIAEDGQLAFTATIAELTDTTLRLQQELVRSREKKDLTLTAVDQESACPDLPK
jgi:hypothetical protein